jgi:hypothetical protein
MVELDVSVRRGSSYGIQEGLIAKLQGGVNYVRLSWASPTDVKAPRTQGMTWDVTWDVTWEYATLTPDVGTTQVRVANLVASKLCARAGEFVTYNNQTRRLVTDLLANSSGVAVGHVDKAFTPAGTKLVALGAEQTAIFEVPELPEITWTFGAEGTVTWSMREVFASEITDAQETSYW